MKSKLMFCTVQRETVGNNFEYHTNNLVTWEKDSSELDIINKDDESMIEKV